MQNSNHASLVLENAHVITGDSGTPRAEAVAIQDNRIWMVGTNQEVASAKSRSTQVIDCQGKTLIPGFNDAHCHLFSFVRKLLSLDFSPANVRSIQDILEIIRRKVQYTPEGNWISGTDYNEFYLKEHRHPTRDDLDKVSPRHPVILIHRSMHACVLNSVAMQQVGITNETEEPEGGIIDRDLETGEPNGILFEMLEYVQTRLHSPISTAELDWAISQANLQYLSHGITSLGEATVTNDLEQWESYRKIKETGKIQSRINMMPGIVSLPQFQSAGLKTGAGNAALRLGSLKIVLRETTGTLQPAQEELNQMVLDAWKAGFQVAIHAVEESTVEAAIQALEYANRFYPQGNRRHRIEHCSECPPGSRQRLKRLQAVIVSQPSFLYYSGERYLAQVRAEAQPWLYPFKSWLDNDLIVAGSSDSPVVPLNPLVGIYAAVTRQADSGQTVLISESVSTRQALDMYTQSGAYASFEEDTKGTLTPGKLADMVMLSSDPIHSPPENIKGITVEMTILDGKVVWEK